MTTPQLLQQAKQGHPDAIAQLMNQSLEAKGIKAAVSRQGDRLRVLLNSDNELNQTLLTQFIHKGIQNLNIPALNVVEVIGQSQGVSQWTQTLKVQAPPPATSGPPVTSELPVSPPPPPTEPAPPPIVEAALPLPDSDFDLSAAALDEDFSLEDELSLAEIDQIVAEAVKEVTTKIQSEIPYDPDDADSTAGIYGISENEDLSDANVPMDDAIRQAMQTDDLDRFIDQELAASDAVTLIEQDGPQGSFGTDATSDETPWGEANVESGSSSSAASSDSSIEGELQLADFASGASVELEAELDSGPALDSEGGAEGDEAEATYESDAARDKESPASRLLLLLVSLLTFGSIAGLIGYSLRAQAGNWRALLPIPGAPLQVVTDDANGDASGESQAENSSDAAEGDSPSDSSDTAEADNGEDASAESNTSDATASETNGDVDEDSGTSDDSEAAASTANPIDAKAAAAIANISCSSVIGGSETLTITQVILEADASAADNRYAITGCLTNHTETSIVSAALKYQGQPAEAAADIVPVDEWSLSSTNEGLGQLTFNELEPNATVPFIAQLPVAEGTTAIDLKSLAWRPEGWSGDAKLLDLEFSMPLQDGK